MKTGWVPSSSEVPHQRANHCGARSSTGLVWVYSAESDTSRKPIRTTEGSRRTWLRAWLKRSGSWVFMAGARA
jgi:hypothetical protein